MALVKIDPPRRAALAGQGRSLDLHKGGPLDLVDSKKSRSGAATTTAV